MDKAQLIVAMLRLLCPYLQDMAKRTNTEIDDVVVNVICNLVNPGNLK